MLGALSELTLLFLIKRLLNMASNKLLPSPSTNTGAKNTFVALGILLLTVAIILWPFVVVWSLNTLFGLSIPMNLHTWLASLVLLTVFSGASRISNRPKNN